MRAKEISEQLAQRVEEVARHLLPAGKRVHDEWHVGNVGGDKGESLKITLAGEKKGLWFDFATNEGGDLLELWRLNRHIGLPEAITEAKRYLGIAEPVFSPQRQNNYMRPSEKSLGENQLNSAVKNYLMLERKLTADTLEKFKIKSIGRDIIFPYWRSNVLIQIKKLGLDRDGGKKRIGVEKNCEPCLFGWQAINNNVREVTLTEGEFDAMTLNQYGINALSLPFGGGTGNKHRWLETEFDRLSLFDDIYLCFDQDETGQSTVIDLIERLGRHRCHVVSLPYKDANECLQRGVTKEAIQLCFASAKSCDPAELKGAETFTKAVIDGFYSEERQRGYSAPWQKSHGKILFRTDELSLWTGINGHGKSQFLGHIILSMMQQGARVCVASLELKPERLLMRLARQAGAVSQPSRAYIQAIHEWYSDKLWIFNVLGNTKTKRLLDVFLYARQRYGIDVFVIDSLMKCGIGEEDYSAQKQFVDQLCDFKNQHQCQIHLIAHPRKGFDESKAPGKMDIKGTGSVSDLADYCFTVWRNKNKEDAIQQAKFSNTSIPNTLAEQFDCLWRCDKNRNGDWEGKFGLWFDPASFQYLDSIQARPKAFVDFPARNNSGNIASTITDMGV